MKERRSLEIEGRQFDVCDIKGNFSDRIKRLPFSIRILLENLIRNHDGKIVTEDEINEVANWKKRYDHPVEVPFFPARVLMQDFTGVPSVADLAAMRDAVSRMGKDPGLVNPLVPVELVVDHSVQVDYFGTEDALWENVAKEYERNQERYSFLKWAQMSFKNLSVVPPNSGICHQVNLEHLSRVIFVHEEGNRRICFPDSVVGLDSHTTMVNGIGVMGWGVGGIEAEAVMLGQPCYMAIPEVIGVRLVGKLPMGVTSTDLVLRITRILREYNVVEKFVEFFGPGMRGLDVPARATIANMSPEYGATMGFFPVDEKVVEYLKLTNRHRRASIVAKAAKVLGLFYNGGDEPEYTDVIEIDMSRAKNVVAGPARPQDIIELEDLKKRYLGIPGKDSVKVEMDGKTVNIRNGSVVIAAIASCTNTSNPHALIGAGLLARNAVKKGIRPPAHVKTSLAPGSRVVVRYLVASGLMPYLEALGFHVAAFGCTTCIGNSGSLHPAIEEAIEDHNLNVAAVLSGNRNFEARIHQKVKANFLASPMLVVAFAIAGRMDIDLTKEPLGLDPNGFPVFFSDICPDDGEIDELVKENVQEIFFEEAYREVNVGDEFWNRLEGSRTTTYPWNDKSTYIKCPPFFDDFSLEQPPSSDIEGARVLLWLGDSVTTDHISPAGAIEAKYPAGRYLAGLGVDRDDFNSYGARRGNHEVMMRGTFGNIRISNRLAGNKKGSFTIKFPENEMMFVYDAARAYRQENVPLIVIGGKEYGSGSSRDWAAKGSKLLGVVAVIAESFERIHRSNLIGMGILPLVFEEGQSAETIGLDGSEVYSISGISKIYPGKPLVVTATKNEKNKSFTVTARLDTEIEVEYYKNGGILNYVLRRIAGE